MAPWISLLVFAVVVNFCAADEHEELSSANSLVEDKAAHFERIRQHMILPTADAAYEFAFESKKSSLIVGLKPRQLKSETRSNNNMKLFRRKVSLDKPSAHFFEKAIFSKICEF